MSETLAGMSDSELRARMRQRGFSDTLADIMIDDREDAETIAWLVTQLNLEDDEC